MVISPHDDDAALGAGLALAAARAEGIETNVAILTDGRMGYADPQTRESIVQTRREETERAYDVLGVHGLHRLELPDGGLMRLQGIFSKRRGTRIRMFGLMPCKH